jgi:hypothetical protein
MLPVIMKVRFSEGERRTFGLWFPVIFVWVLLAALLVVLLPFLVLAAILAWPSGYGKRILSVYPLLGSVLFNLSGLHIELAQTRRHILIDFQ